MRTNEVDAYISTHGLPPLSFDSNEASQHTLPDSIQSAQNAVLEATDELHALMLGPMGILRQQVVCLSENLHLPRYLTNAPDPTQFSFSQLMSLQTINRFKIAETFPQGKDTMSYAELSHGTGLQESQLRRILRRAMTLRIFTEPTKDSVGHTAASKMLTKPYVHQWIGWACDEMWPAATKVHITPPLCAIGESLTSHLGRGCASQVAGLSGANTHCMSIPCQSLTAGYCRLFLGV